MAIYYFDSSAIVKLYITEPGTNWVTALFRAKNPDGARLHRITFSKIGIVEVSAAIARRYRMQMLTKESQRALYRRFMQDCVNQFRTLNPSNDQIYQAAELVQEYALRGYDAIHLATALALSNEFVSNQLPTITFVSADQQLARITTARNAHLDILARRTDRGGDILERITPPRRRHRTGFAEPVPGHDGLER